MDEGHDEAGKSRIDAKGCHEVKFPWRLVSFTYPGGRTGIPLPDISIPMNLSIGSAKFLKKRSML